MGTECVTRIGFRDLVSSTTGGVRTGTGALATVVVTTVVVAIIVVAATTVTAAVLIITVTTTTTTVVVVAVVVIYPMEVTMCNRGSPDHTRGEIPTEFLDEGQVL